MVSLLHSIEATSLLLILPHPVKQKKDVGKFPLLSVHYPASVMSALAPPKQLTWKATIWKQG
jgi:hypothetical protein